MSDLHESPMPSTGLTPDIADFYATHSSFSAPGALAALYIDLPPDPARLARIARDLMIHRWEGGNYRYDIPRERLHNDAETRYIDAILAIIVERDDTPLPRPATSMTVSSACAATSRCCTARSCDTRASPHACDRDSRTISATMASTTTT
jgi:hypothetical protein